MSVQQITLVMNNYLPTPTPTTLSNNYSTYPICTAFVSIFCISVYFNIPNYDSLPQESISVFTKVRFGPFRSVSVPRESISVLKEAVSVSTKVRFGPFRSVSVLREAVSVLKESVSASTKVRFGPFRSVSVHRESVSVLKESVSVSTKFRFGPSRSVSVRSGPFR